MKKEDKYFYDIEFIKEKMVEHKLMGTELARRTDIRYHTIKSILSHKQRATIDSMGRINKVLGINNGKHIVQHSKIGITKEQAAAIRAKCPTTIDLKKGK